MVRPMSLLHILHNSKRTSVQRSAVHILTALHLLTSLQSICAEPSETEVFDIMMPYAPNRAIAPTIRCMVVGKLKKENPCEIACFDSNIKILPFFQSEGYHCTGASVDFAATSYIVGFEPIAKKNAHNMILYGCARPDVSYRIYNCGETTDNNYCITGQHSQILFSWAPEADGYMLPDGIGFKIGKGTKIEYVVLQVHYERQLASGDESGMRIHFTQQVMPRQAGILLLRAGGSINPYTIVPLEVACTINEWKTIYPFAYRTHTHSLGKMVSGYSVVNVRNRDVWTLLGQRDPKTKQSFYPVMNNVSLTGPDILAARCTMNSKRNYITYNGPREDDEMCNFYLMYYVKNNEQPLHRRFCYSEGPPNSYWITSELHLQNIPE